MYKVGDDVLVKCKVIKDERHGYFRVQSSASTITMPADESDIVSLAEQYCECKGERNTYEQTYCGKCNKPCKYLTPEMKPKEPFAPKDTHWDCECGWKPYGEFCPSCYRPKPSAPNYNPLQPLVDHFAPKPSVNKCYCAEDGSYKCHLHMDKPQAKIEKIEPETLDTFNIRKEINSLVRNDIMELTRKVNEIIDHLNKEGV